MSACCLSSIMGNKKSIVPVSLTLVYGDQTQDTSIKLSTQNYLLSKNAIYTILESQEKVDIIEPPVTDKSYATW